MLGERGNTCFDLGTFQALHEFLGRQCGQCDLGALHQLETLSTVWLASKKLVGVSEALARRVRRTEDQYMPF